jgi:hypothetical protein
VDNVLPPRFATILLSPLDSFLAAAAALGTGPVKLGLLMYHSFISNFASNRCPYFCLPMGCLCLSGVSAWDMDDVFFCILPGSVLHRSMAFSNVDEFFW